MDTMAAPTGYPFLTGGRIYLRALSEQDAEGPYISWLNDASVCQGTSHHVFPYTYDDAIAYIKESNATHHRLALAVVTRGDNQHIGNIALNNIRYPDRVAELALVLGDCTMWGKGYGKEAARLICDHGFLVLNLHRIYCGTFAHNVAMCKLAAHLEDE